MAERLGGEAISLEDAVAGPLDVDMVINATSVSSEDESPEFAALVARLDLNGCQLLMDLNYGRDNNIWENRARDARRVAHLPSGRVSKSNPTNFFVR